MADPDARSRTGARDARADDLRGDRPNDLGEDLPKAVRKDAQGGDTLQRANPDDDLPIVARLVIEIRSDGTRTVARGALEQADLGERIGVEARGGSPAALAADLLRAIISLPLHSSLSRWTGHDKQPKASIEPTKEPAPGVVGQVRRALAGRLRRKLGLDR
ncbi:MAG: hypothetical protein H0T76_07710 [Nannocystis sp.]|nr:hypothetical protein [Nannocystis sp.]MBA3546351.1 hypothetical protein [Nannocystis sp.]